MNVNKICAAVSALCLSATAVLLAGNAGKNTPSFAGSLKFGDIDGNDIIDARDATLLLSYYAYVSTHDQISLEEYIAMQDKETAAQTTTTQTTTAPPATSPDVKLKSGGDTFTIAVWNADNYPRFVSQWLGVTEDAVIDSNYSQSLTYDPLDKHPLTTLKTPSGAKLNIINFGAGGAEAGEKYEELFKSGEDIDVYYCENGSWMYKFINNDQYTAPLSDLGFKDEDFAQTYSYTDKLGKDQKGVRKAVSPFICPGGFAYRTDLAKQYLGISSSTEMQKSVGSWDGFVSTAKTLSTATNGTVALGDTYGGIFQAYLSEHKLTNQDSTVTDDAKIFADYAKTLWDCGGISKNGQWTDEWTANGVNEKVMGYFIPSWGVNGFLTRAADNSEGKWDIVPGPEPFYWGGIWTVVNPATDNADDCASFIRSSCLNADSMVKAAGTDNYYLPNNKAAMAELLADPTKTNLNSNTVFSGNNLLGVLSSNAEKIVPAVYTFEKEDDYNWDLRDIIEDDYLKYENSWDETVDTFYNIKQRAYKDKIKYVNF